MVLVNGTTKDGIKDGEFDYMQQGQAPQVIYICVDILITSLCRVLIIQWLVTLQLRTHT